MKGPSVYYLSDFAYEDRHTGYSKLREKTYELAKKCDSYMIEHFWETILRKGEKNIANDKFHIIYEYTDKSNPCSQFLVGAHRLNYLTDDNFHIRDYGISDVIKTTDGTKVAKVAVSMSQNYRWMRFDFTAPEYQ